MFEVFALTLFFFSQHNNDTTTTQHNNDTTTTQHTTYHTTHTVMVTTPFIGPPDVDMAVSLLVC